MNVKEGGIGGVFPTEHRYKETELVEGEVI